MDLKIDYSSKPLSQEKLDALVVFAAEDTNLRGSGLSGLPNALKKPIASALDLGVFSGKKGATHHLVTGDTKWKQALLAGFNSTILQLERSARCAIQSLSVTASGAAALDAT